MARFGLNLGQSYQSASVNADCQRCMNLYGEANESGQGNSSMILLNSPGLRIFATLPAGPVRGQFYFNGRHFAVGGVNFCEILAGGNVTVRAAVASDGTPISMAANQANQLLIASAGQLYVYNLLNNTISQPSPSPSNIVQVGYADGFFIALTANSNLFQISNPLDGTTWNGLNVAEISVFPDQIVSMAIDHRELAFLGSKQSVIYYDSGNTFPYDVVPGGFIEQGAAAVWGTSKLDNSVFWLGADERGQGVAWRNNGYTPQRISTHAVELAWSRYPRISDAISYSFQRRGHTIWHIYFPSGLNDSGLPLGASWRYDAATQLWHEVAFWDSTNGRYTAHRSQNHAFAFGLNLVGDWNSGNIYQMDDDILDDFGNNVRRFRRAPHVSTEKQRMFHDSVQLDMESGVTPQPNLTGPDMGPPRYISSFILQAPNGGLWQVTIDDNGNPNIVSVSSGTPRTVILADSGLIPTTAWQLNITNAGNLNPVLVSAQGGSLTVDDPGPAFPDGQNYALGDTGFLADELGALSASYVVTSVIAGAINGVTITLLPGADFIVGNSYSSVTGGPQPGIGTGTGGGTQFFHVTAVTPGVSGVNPANYLQFFPMASTPGNHPTGILITKDGLLQTNTPDQRRGPQICLRWSDDGGHTWSNEHWKSIGKPGQYKKRVIWRRLGWSWDRVYEISMSDPVPWRIIDAYLDASPGFQPQERLVHQLRKGA